MSTGDNSISAIISINHPVALGKALHIVYPGIGDTPYSSLVGDQGKSIYYNWQTPDSYRQGCRLSPVQCS